MTNTREELFSIAVFPYLKTSGPVQLGPYLFRSTDDLERLTEAQAMAVTDVTAMLYAQNNARVRSASYAAIPQIHISGLFQIPEVLKRVHSLVAYLYGTPNDQFGDPFLGYECATLLVLTPARVSRFLIEPEHHTILAIFALPLEYAELSIFEDMQSSKIWKVMPERAEGHRAFGSNDSAYSMPLARKQAVCPAHGIARV
jgi:hypothetical protein